MKNRATGQPILVEPIVHPSVSNLSTATLNTGYANVNLRFTSMSHILDLELTRYYRLPWLWIFSSFQSLTMLSNTFLLTGAASFSGEESQSHSLWLGKR